MTNIDLRLLTIITELHRTRSVSQTAENLELSQSTVSMSLARLRKHFNDPLFVRTSSGMEPTPHCARTARRQPGCVRGDQAPRFTLSGTNVLRDASIGTSGTLMIPQSDG
jgi:DNA-binding transcriptional LysR family regulator